MFIISKLYCSFLKGAKILIIPLLLTFAGLLDVINGKLDTQEQNLREQVWGKMG